MTELNEALERLKRAENIVDLAKNIVTPPRFDLHHFIAMEAALKKYDGWDWQEISPEEKKFRQMKPPKEKEQ